MTGEVEQLLVEHLASWRQYGAAQQRCSQVISAQHARIAQLEAELMRARAACIVQATALDWADEERASFVAADLVICQTGCLSHGDYWRVQDHCRRTGKACLVVAPSDAVHIVRLHRLVDAGER